jgi:hypothetical protein
VRRSRMLFGLPALTVAAACSTADPRPARPLQERTGAPACGNIGHAGRPSAPGCPGDEASLPDPAAARDSVSPGEVARPRLDAQGAPAPGNVITKTTVAPVASSAALQAAAPAGTAPHEDPLVTSDASAAARPLVDKDGCPACGNVQGKGSTRRRRKSPGADRVMP